MNTQTRELLETLATNLRKSVDFQMESIQKIGKEQSELTKTDEEVIVVHTIAGTVLGSLAIVIERTIEDLKD